MKKIIADVHRHVFFFDHKQEGFPGNFASMNIVNRHDLLIILISVPHVVLEIRNKRLLNLILQYFRGRDNKYLLNADTSKKIVEIAKETIVSADTGSGNSTTQFLKRCDEHRIEGRDFDLIRDQFPQHRV